MTLKSQGLRCRRDRATRTGQYICNMCIYIDLSVSLSRPPPPLCTHTLSFCLSVYLSVSVFHSVSFSLFLVVRSLKGQTRLPDIRLFLLSENLSHCHNPPFIGLSITLSFALVLALTLSP